MPPATQSTSSRPPGTQPPHPSARGSVGPTLGHCAPSPSRSGRPRPHSPAAPTPQPGGKGVCSPQTSRLPEDTHLPKVAVALLLQRLAGRGQQSVSHAGNAGAVSGLRLGSCSGPRGRSDPPPPRPRDRPSHPTRGQSASPGDPAGPAKATPLAPPLFLIGGAEPAPRPEAGGAGSWDPWTRCSLSPSLGGLTWTSWLSQPCGARAGRGFRRHRKARARDLAPSSGVVGANAARTDQVAARRRRRRSADAGEQ